MAKMQIFLIVSTCFLYLVAAGLFSKAVWFLENNTVSLYAIVCRLTPNSNSGTKSSVEMLLRLALVQDHTTSGRAYGM